MAAPNGVAQLDWFMTEGILGESGSSSLTRIKVLFEMVASFLVVRPQQSFLGSVQIHLMRCVYILQRVFVHLNLHQGEVTSADWRSQIYLWSVLKLVAWVWLSHHVPEAGSLCERDPNVLLCNRKVAAENKSRPLAMVTMMLFVWIQPFTAWMKQVNSLMWCSQSLE